MFCYGSLGKLIQRPWRSFHPLEGSVLSPWSWVLTFTPEPSCHPVRKPKLAHMEGPHQEIRCCSFCRPSSWGPRWQPAPIIRHVSEDSSRWFQLPAIESFQLMPQTHGRWAVPAMPFPNLEFGTEFMHDKMVVTPLNLELVCYTATAIPKDTSRAAPTRPAFSYKSKEHHSPSRSPPPPTLIESYCCHLVDNRKNALFSLLKKDIFIHSFLHPTNISQSLMVKSLIGQV